MDICKSDVKQLLSLMERAAAIIKNGNPKPSEYNVARQLGNLKRKFEKRNICLTPKNKNNEK